MIRGMKKFLPIAVIALFLGVFLIPNITKAADICKKYVEKNVGSTKFIIKKVFNN